MVKPPSARSVVPGPGRLGLVENTAADELRQLGWVDSESIELLWSLSRSANADLALRTLVRIKDSLGDGWSDLDDSLRKDKSLRGRLLGLIGASAAFGDHLVADPSAWRILDGTSLPTKDAATTALLGAVGATLDEGATPARRRTALR